MASRARANLPHIGRSVKDALCWISSYRALAYGTNGNDLWLALSVKLSVILSVKAPVSGGKYRPVNPNKP